MEITQQPDGIVEGQWSGQLSVPDPECPPGLGGNPTGTVSGRNSVLEVRLSLLGAGDFVGQVGDDGTVQGSFESCNNVYPIKFLRVASTP